MDSALTSAVSQSFMGAECLMVCAVDVLLAIYLIRAERLYSGGWFPWQGRRISLGWSLAIYCLSNAAIYLALALVILARSSPHIELWAILLVTITGASSASLFLAFARSEGGGDE